jgi:hypothetical protein
MASDIFQLFAKYNKNYQVYFLTLNGHLALFFILTSDIDIHHPYKPFTIVLNTQQAKVFFVTLASGPVI